MLIRETDKEKPRSEVRIDLKSKLRPQQTGEQVLEGVT